MGLGRGIAVERPAAWGGIIDSDGDAAAIAEHVCAEIGSPDGEDQTAWRGGIRYVPRLGRQPEPAIEVRARAADRSYLVTGGLGGVGLLVARALVRRGARHLVLASRTPLDSGNPADPEVQRRRRAVDELRALGATVSVAAVDVADEAAMGALFAQFGTTAPRLGGVFHAAAVLGASPLQELDLAAIETMYRAKIGGAVVLDRLTRGLDIEDFVLFSSTTALLGASGFAHYAAANTFMDAVACARHARSLPALSVNWGPWEAMRTFTEAEQASASRVGLVPMSADRAMALLDHALAGGWPTRVIAAIDWAVLKPAYEARRARPILSAIGVRDERVAVNTAEAADRPARSAWTTGRGGAIGAPRSAGRCRERCRGLGHGVPGRSPHRLAAGLFRPGDGFADDRGPAGAAWRARGARPAGRRDVQSSLDPGPRRVPGTRGVRPGGDAAIAAPRPIIAAVEPPRRAEAEVLRSIDETLSLIDAELSAIDDLVRD